MIFKKKKNLLWYNEKKKDQRMKGLLLIGIIASIGFANEGITLDIYEKSFNKNAYPLKIDKYTKFHIPKVNKENNEIDILYTINKEKLKKDFKKRTNKSYESSGFENKLKEDLKAGRIKATCKDKVLKKLLEKNTKMKYRYDYTTGEKLIEFNITKENCK
jgi:hypothetical protein